MRAARAAINKTMFAVCLTSSLLVSGSLLVILAVIFSMALPSLSLYFIITPESETPGLGGGVGNAVAGTLLISIMATAIASPLAMGTAVYLQKYAGSTRWVRGFRFLLEVLSGTPSIILGMFGLMFLAMTMKYYTGGYSLIGGAIALSILILPVIERAMEEAISAVPEELEHGSYALGATKWLTLRLVTIPTALSGIITGMILGFGRAAEESAVVIFTASYTQFFPEFGVWPNDDLVLGMKIYPLQDLVATLPVTVYNSYLNRTFIPVSDAFATAFVLITLVLCINMVAKWVLWKYGHD